MPSNLRTLVQDRLDELGISEREAGRRSGGLVSYETIRNITHGRHSGRIGSQTAYGLAKALGLDLDDIYAAAGLQRSEPWVLPPGSDGLTQPQRRAVERVIGSLLAANEEINRLSRDLEVVNEEFMKRWKR